MQAAKDFFLEALHIPNIGAVRLKRCGDTGVDGSIAQQEIWIGRLGTFFDEAGQRHTPRALA